MRRIKIENIACGLPYLAEGKTAETFALIRSETEKATGYDFFSVCGDLARAADFVSKKPGVANRSWHKAHRAVDFDQTSKNFVLVYEPRQGRAYFRTYLKIENETAGVNLRERDIDVYSNAARKNMAAPAGEFFDLTACFSKHGWRRIPAWRTWNYGKGYSTTQEFWHYQYDEGMSWQEAMDWLVSDTAAPTPSYPRQRLIGRNDRGADVEELQRLLVALRYLDAPQIDGVFGKFTHDALKTFQAAHSLRADGIAGPATWRALRAAQAVALKPKPQASIVAPPLPASPVPPLPAAPVPLPAPPSLVIPAQPQPQSPPTISVAVPSFPAPLPAPPISVPPSGMPPSGMRASESPIIIGAGEKLAFRGIASTSGVGVVLTALYAFWQANAVMICVVFGGGLLLAVTVLVCLHQRHENNKARAANPCLDNVE